MFVSTKAHFPATQHYAQLHNNQIWHEEEISLPIKRLKIGAEKTERADLYYIITLTWRQTTDDESIFQLQAPSFSGAIPQNTGSEKQEHSHSSLRKYTHS